jgi:HlyD family secretion protein
VKKVILVVVVVVIGAGIVGGWRYFNKGKASKVTFRTAEVTRGDILSTISATGTVEPEELVDVGAQVDGQILSFGKDVNGNPIDYGSVVQKGMLLAHIDESTYAADVNVADAQVRQGKAGIEFYEATLLQLKAKLELAEADWERAQKLGPSEALAKSSYDSYKSAYEIAKANVTVGEAQLQQAKESVFQSEASLAKAKRNLGYCKIYSPVDGIIIDRRVNIGQTIVSNMSTSSLFLIAKDLKRMQVWVAVNEADIGKIYPGQPVTFEVDAFPGRIFKGEVNKVRLNATVSSNVITYVVEVTTDNSSRELLPYLSASVHFEIGRSNNAMQVTNAALRWSPSATQYQANTAQASTLKNSNEKGTVWVEGPQGITPVSVEAGLTDGTMTEIKTENLHEGDGVIVGEQTADQKNASSSGSNSSAGASSGTGTATTNPFMPQMPKRTRNIRPPGGPPP